MHAWSHTGLLHADISMDFTLCGAYLFERVPAWRPAIGFYDDADASPRTGTQSATHFLDHGGVLSRNTFIPTNFGFKEIICMHESCPGKPLNIFAESMPQNHESVPKNLSIFFYHLGYFFKCKINVFSKVVIFGINPRDWDTV
mmetsp:Transcript_34704/g.83982  ORF Transcript_34704/g.83982 Transcript_34704/m.83982 type:complete len:143 (+) Transcript_34704:170-598(+)